MFNITDVPFSYFGSWMSISIPRGEEDIFFRNCHNGAHDVFPIRLLVNGELVKPEITASPWLLVLTHGDARIEICFESAGTVRMRGHGAEIQLGDKHLIYSEAPNRAVINHRGALRRYGIEVLHGDIELKQLVPTQPVFPRIARIKPESDGRWELAIDEFWSTWQRPTRTTFDASLDAAEKAFKDFLATMPQARNEDQATRELATYVDWSCTVGVCGLIKRPTMFMSKNWMCNVWSWDQCFNAMAMAAGQPKLAFDQMLTLVDHQDEFGSYPDSINDITIHYNYSKPPVHGWALSEILKRVKEPVPGDILQTMYISLSRQAEWWLTHRVLTVGNTQIPNDPNTQKGIDPEVGRSETVSRGLPYYLHGNDSGWDNSTMFNQGVPLIAPDLAALLVLQMDVLSDLAVQVGEDGAAEAWNARADALQCVLFEELWRGDHFVARRGTDGADVESRSLIPWLPIILGDRLPREVRECLKKGIENHLTPWGLSTEHVDSPNYNPDGYWTGPIWAPSTYIAVTGLDRCGFSDLADDVSERFCRMCGQSGFAENFDALTGAALCDKAYTWTASVFLLLAERMLQRQSQP